MAEPGIAVQLGAAARRMVRSRGHAALGTSLAGRPYVSLVATACEMDASPLLLLSDLAQHTKNLAAGPFVSLLFEDVAGHPAPLAGPRPTPGAWIGDARWKLAAKRRGSTSRRRC